MAWTEKRGRKTLVVWREADGTKKSKSFPTSASARLFRADLEVKLLGGTYVPESERRQLLGPYIEAVIQNDLRLRSNTRNTQLGIMRRHVISSPLGLMEIGAVRPQDVRTLLSTAKAAGTGIPMLEKVRMILVKCLNVAVGDGIIPSNPASSVPAPRPVRRQVRVLSAQEVQAVSLAIEPRYRCLVLLAAYGGLRIGELAALRWENVDLLRRRVTVVEGISGEGERLEVQEPKTAAGRRSVAIPAFVAEALAEHANRYLRDDWTDLRVFSTPNGGYATSGEIRPAWKRALRAAGLPAGTHFHDLRHTSVAFAIQQGAHPKEIQARVGHANIATTLDTYGHLFEGMDDRLAEKMNEAYGTQEEGKVVELHG